MSSRKSKVEPLEVQGTLTGASVSPAKPSPVERVAPPSSPALSTGSASVRSFHSHGKSMSDVSAAPDNSHAPPRHNRFSMSFPVQPSASSSPTRIAQSPTREVQPESAESASTPTAQPSDTNFLTAIAKQERRVLELKEELARAEVGLGKLKKQWQQHEAQKKRSEARSVTKLQSLQTALPTSTDQEDSDGSSAWMQQEMERRKALLNGNKPSSRTVFSGSKHTRTLSLLSPVQHKVPPVASQMLPPPRPPRKESLSESARRSQDLSSMESRPKAITRASTTSDLGVDGSSKPQGIVKDGEEGLPDKAMDGDVLLQTSKKMATEFRDGLWTFWEDLRQVAVGEDTAQVPPPRRQTSSQTLRSAKKQKSQTSLRPSSRGSSTASKASTDTKRTSPSRSRHNKSATMSLSSTPALADPSFWAAHGVNLDKQPTKPVTTRKNVGASPRHAKSASKISSTGSSESDAWDNWEASSPQGSRSSIAESDTVTLPSTVSSPTSPKMSSETPTKSSDAGAESTRKDPIPWPALSNLGPKALRRTASHLMSEWEKSLTPSPVKDSAGQSDYLGLGAEAAASVGR